MNKRKGIEKGEKSSKKLVTIVMTAMIVFSLMPALVPMATAAPATISTFTITPATGTAGETAAYTVQLNTSGFKSLNITIPARFEAVEPASGELVARADLWWNDTGQTLYGYVTFTANAADPTDKMDVYADIVSSGSEATLQGMAVDYAESATTSIKSPFGAHPERANLTLPTTENAGWLNITGLPDTITNITVSIGQFVKNPATAGNYTFDADGEPAYVRIPGIELNAEKGPKESWIWINGSNFASGEYVGLYFDDVYWTSVRADGDGVLNKSAEIPAAGASWVNATGDKGSKASTTFNVTTPNVTLIPDEGPIGANITINATGFVVGATLKDQYWNGTAWYTINTSTANGGGNHSFTDVTIRDDISTTTMESESVNIRVEGTSGAVIPDKQPKCYAYALYQIGVPSITLDPARGPPGVQINVTGKTFSAPDVVGTILLSNATWQNPYPVGGFTTDVNGGFTDVSITIPGDLAYEPYTITARDAENKNATAVFNVTKAPELTVTPDTGAVDINVTLKATGFRPEEDIVISYFNETSNWSVSYTVETGVGGEHTNETWKVPKDINTTVSPNLQANQTGYGSAKATYTVTPTIGITPNNGTVDTEVTVKGDAFGNVTVYLDARVVNETSTDAAGKDIWAIYNRTFNVPATPSGNYTVNVTDQKGLFNTTTFTVRTNITLNATERYVGDMVIVNGTAFGASKTVDILFNESKVTEATTDVNGTFTMATFAVPPIANETYNVTAQDSTERSATATFDVLTKLVVSPETGDVAKNVTLTGTAFGANENVTLRLRNTTSVVHEFTVYPTTNEDGTFEQVVTIPEVISGDCNFTATGNTSGYSDKASFEVLMTLFLKSYRDKAGIGLIEINGSWPNEVVAFKVTQNGYTIPTKALMYFDEHSTTFSNETTGFYNYSFEEKKMFSVQAKDHAKVPPFTSNIINITIADPVLKLSANDTTVNPGQSVQFNLTDQFGYPIEGASLYEGTTNISGFLSEYTDKNGNIMRVYVDVEVYKMHMKWTWKGSTYLSNDVNITVKDAAVTIEPKTKTIDVNDPVEFKLYNEWSEAVDITGIAVTPGTAGVNWTKDMPNATVTFLKEDVYNVTATNETSGLNDTAVITVGVRPLTVTANVTIVAMNTPTAVEFNVTASDGAAVEGALVSVSQAGTELVNGTTASTGLVTLSVNATSEDAVNVTATKTGYREGTTTITVTWDPWSIDGIITDEEIQAAVYHWVTDTPKNGHLVTDEEIQALVYMWLTT